MLMRKGGSDGEVLDWSNVIRKTCFCLLWTLFGKMLCLYNLDKHYVNKVDLLESISIEVKLFLICDSKLVVFNYLDLVCQL